MLYLSNHDVRKVILWPEHIVRTDDENQPTAGKFLRHKVDSPPEITDVSDRVLVVEKHVGATYVNADIDSVRRQPETNVIHSFTYLLTDYLSHLTRNETTPHLFYRLINVVTEAHR